MRPVALRAPSRAHPARGARLQPPQPNTTQAIFTRLDGDLPRCSPKMRVSGPLSTDISGILTRLSTYKNHLPTGSPLSPILSFYAHCDMWAEVAKLAAEYDCRLSVYLDNITISGPRVPDRLVWQVKQAIHRNGLGYHKSKRFPKGRAREVTGVILDTDGPKLPYRHYQKLHRLRQDLASAKSEQDREALTRKIQGLQAQARQVATQQPRIAS